MRSARRQNALSTGLVLPLLLAAAVSGAGAQEAAPTATPGAPDAPEVVTFGDAVSRALRLGTDVLRSRADLRLRGTVETREWMSFVPQLSLSTRAGRSFGRSFSQEEGEILSETNDVFDGGIGADLTLFDGMQRLSSIREASLEEEASRLRLSRTEQDVVFQVVEGFIGLVQARELAAVRREELVAGQELLDQVERLTDLGRAPLSDLYQQQAVFAESEAALVEAERQVEIAETRLLQVLELDPLGTYDFRAPDLPDADAVGAPPGYDAGTLIAAAYENRQDLAATERALRASEEGVDAAQAGYWPTVNLSFNYGSNWSGSSRQAVPGTGSPPETVTIRPMDGGAPITLEVPGTGSSPRFVQPGFLDQLDARRGGSVSLSLSLPLFDGLQTRTAVAQAEVARLNARYDMEDRRQQVALEVRQAVLDHRAAVAQREATGRRLDAAERAWTAAERRYELGAATFVEVVQARSGLVAARSAAIQARFDVLLAERRIDYHTGTLSPDSFLAVSDGN